MFHHLYLFYTFKAPTDKGGPASPMVLGMVQAWVGQKLVNVTFYKFFDV